MSNNIQSISVLAAMALFALSSPLSGEDVSLDMAMEIPGPGSNRLEMQLTATAFGITRSDTDTSELSGNVLAHLQIDFDPVTYDVNQVTGLEFTGGTINLTETADFHLVFAPSGDIDVSGTGISGTLDTPNPPQPVLGTTFNASEHQLILNSGTFHVLGTGPIGGLFDPFTIDLYTDPIVTSNSGTGTILVSLLSVVGHTATYQTSLTMPIDFLEQIYSDPSIIMELAGFGTLEAQGQFARCTLRADLTGDCFVNREDLVEFCCQWLAFDEFQPCPWTADLTADDCYVDFLDFAILACEWLQ